MAGYQYTSAGNVRKVMRKLPTSITDADITYCIQQADALIDSKLKAVFTVPLSFVPPLVEKISTDLSVFFLAESLYSSNAPNLDEYQVKRYERAMEWLDNMVADETGSTGSDFGSTTDSEPYFTFEDPEW